MRLKDRILQSLRPRKNGILLRSDIHPLGSPSQISTALSSLVESGLIEKLARGVYAKPAQVAEFGKDAMLTKAALRIKGLSHGVGRRQARKHYPTATARYVDNLARKNNINFTPTYADYWAKSVTNLAGDEIKSDRTDDLLVALTRSGKMTPQELVSLIIKHHRDLKRV